jgi:hypothetical protein
MEEEAWRFAADDEVVDEKCSLLLLRVNVAAALDLHHCS